MVTKKNGWMKKEEKRSKRGRRREEREKDLETACEECLRVPYVTNRRREATFMERGKPFTYIVRGRQATPECHTDTGDRISSSDNRERESRIFIDVFFFFF